MSNIFDISERSIRNDIDTIDVFLKYNGIEKIQKN